MPNTTYMKSKRVTKNEAVHEIFVTDCTCLPATNRGSPSCYGQYSRTTSCTLTELISRRRYECFANLLIFIDHC